MASFTAYPSIIRMGATGLYDALKVERCRVAKLRSDIETRLAKHLAYVSEIPDMFHTLYKNEHLNEAIKYRTDELRDLNQPTEACAINEIKQLDAWIETIDELTSEFEEKRDEENIDESLFQLWFNKVSHLRHLRLSQLNPDIFTQLKFKQFFFYRERLKNCAPRANITNFIDLPYDEQTQTGTQWKNEVDYWQVTVYANGAKVGREQVIVPGMWTDNWYE